MKEGYADGEAIFVLMQAYQKNEDGEQAAAIYQRILELYPDSELATKATEIMAPQDAAGEGSDTQETE